MKREWLKWLKLAAELIVIAAVVWVIVFFLQGMGLADGSRSKLWVMCKPGDYVNVRAKPSTKAESIGYLQSGDWFYSDLETGNGWIHAVDMSLEETEGWVYVGYVVVEEPVWMGGEEATISADGRVACRRWCDGPRIEGRGGWVKPGATVQVFYRTGQWSLTNRGYIKTEYLK